MKRAESVTKRNHASRNGSGSRHRRLSSLRFKQSRGSNRFTGFLERAFPLLGLGSLGIVAIITAYNVFRLDARSGSLFHQGFSYNKEEGFVGGDRGNYLDGDPLRTPMARDKSASGSRYNPADTSIETKHRRNYEPPPNLPRRPIIPRRSENLRHSSMSQPSLEEDPGPPEETPPKNAAREERPKGSEAKDGKRDSLSGKNKKSFFKSRPPKISLEDKVAGSRPRGGWYGGVYLDVDKDTYQISTSQPRSGWSAGSGEMGRAVVINADDPQQQRVEWINRGGGDRQQRFESQEVVPRLGQQAALLVICANRPEYLERALSAVVKYHPRSWKGEAKAMPVLISQDGYSPGVEEVISRFKSSMAGIARVIHIRHEASRGEIRPYYKLSAHYKWALLQAFDELDVDGYNHALVNNVIILEEDLEIAPDFFEYFAATVPLLDRDETLMAVSAWNDNGQVAHVKDSQALVRTDFFPGLGWMLPRRVWDELQPAWPLAYWDDWLREPDRRKGRQFIRPEVCRTYHFGSKGGASKNQFAPHLDSIKLNKFLVAFREMDLSYLEPKMFEAIFRSRIAKAPLASIGDIIGGRSPSREVVVEYSGQRAFAALARELGVMSDFKAGVPRTAYMGVVSVWVHDTKVHLAPTGFKSSLSTR